MADARNHLHDRLGPGQNLGGHGTRRSSTVPDLDPHLWREVEHNPIAFLNQITPEQVEERAAELVLHSRINHAFRRLNEYMENERTWGAIHCGNVNNRPVVYFSAEFGLHESLPVYSGGLGILAGDHLKSASDLGIPLIGIGLLYQQGYFNQRLNHDGWLEEDYVDLDIARLPSNCPDQRVTSCRPDRHEDHPPAPGVAAPVGRVRLMLLDSNVQANSRRPGAHEPSLRRRQQLRIRQSIAES
jgi:starch phosphorylase